MNRTLIQPDSQYTGFFIFKLIDYAARKMNVYAPANYRYLGSGDVLPTKFIDKRSFISVKITMEGGEAVEGAVELETASSGVLVVQRSFAEAHQLLKSVKGFRLGNVGGSVGGCQLSNDGGPHVEI